MRTRRRRRTNPIAAAIVFFIMGVILAIVAITTDPNNVTCDGQTMNAGDQCIHTVNGVQTSVDDIDQQRQSQQNDRIFEIICAVLCFIAGGAYIMRFTKTRAALKNGVAYTRCLSPSTERLSPAAGSLYPATRWLSSTIWSLSSSAKWISPAAGSLPSATGWLSSTTWGLSCSAEWIFPT